MESELEKRQAEIEQEANYSLALSELYEALAVAKEKSDRLEQIFADSKSPELPQHHVKVRWPEFGVHYERKADAARQVLEALKPQVFHEELKKDVLEQE